MIKNKKRPPRRSFFYCPHNSEKAKLRAFGNALENALGRKRLGDRFRHARPLFEALDGLESALFPLLGDNEGGVFTDAGQTRKGRQKPILSDDGEARGVRLFEVYGEERKSPSVKLHAGLQNGDAVLILVGRLGVLLYGSHACDGRLLALYHDGRVEIVAADGEIGAVKLDGVIDLVIRQPQGRRDVGDGVSLREHIFYLFAGVYIPLGDLVLPHKLLPLGLKAFAFTDGLHYVERALRGQIFGEKIEHYVVAGAYRLLEGGGMALYKFVAVALPDVGAVRQTRDPYKLLDGGRLGVGQNTADEVGAKLGD